MLKEAYGDEQMSQASFYRWFNRFSDGNEQVENERRSGAPQTARKKKNIQEVEKVVMQDCQLSVRMIFEIVNASVGTILTEDLNLQKICTMFTQKESCRRTIDSSVWNAALNARNDKDQFKLVE